MKPCSINFRLQVTGCRLQVAGYRLQVTGCGLQAATCHLPPATCKKNPPLKRGVYVVTTMNKIQFSGERITMLISQASFPPKKYL